MAVSSEHLQCSICQKFFNNPRTLIPCLHTFCEVCLHDCIMDSVARGKVNAGFKCPFCTAFVPEPATTNKSPGEWAAIFPLNHLIVSLLDTFKATKILETKSGEYSKTEIAKSKCEQYHHSISNRRQSKDSDSDEMIRNGILIPVISSMNEEQNLNTTRTNSKNENQAESDAFVTQSSGPTYVNLKIEVGRGDNNVTVCFDDSDYTKLAQAADVVPDLTDEPDYVLLKKDANLTNFFDKESYVPDKIIPSDSDALLPPPPPPCGSRPRTAQQHFSPFQTSSNHQKIPNRSSPAYQTPRNHPVKSYSQYGPQQPQIGPTSYHPFVTGYTLLYGDF